MAIQHKLGGIFSPVLTPFKTDLSPDTQALRAPLPVADRQRSRPGGVRHQLRSQLALASASASACSTPLLAAGVPAARMMPGTGCCVAHRHRGTDPARDQGRRRRRADAAALLLQGRLGRRPVPQLRRDHRARRRQPAAHLPVPHPAGVPGADQPEPDRAAAQGLPHRHRRHQGQLGRLDQHRGDARAVPAAGLRRVRGQRGVPAARPCAAAARAASPPPATSIRRRW